VGDLNVEKIECIPVDLTDEQRTNLAKLAAYLRTLPADYPDFAMNDFVLDSSGKKGIAHVASCGTAACAVGHGPKAGIKPKSGESWHAYSYRTLIPIMFGDDVDDDAWAWCFSGIWAHVDNTVHGAAARIEWMLEHGVPKNGSGQRFGCEPLCYTVEAA
jgi:hypothetical protein